MGRAGGAYLPLFAERNPTLDWLQNQSWEQLDRYARQLDRIHPEDRATIKWHYAEVTARPWLKGIIATYLAVMVRARGASRRPPGRTRLVS